MPTRARRLQPLVAVGATALALVASQTSAQGCLPWGDQDDINTRLQGPGAVVELSHLIIDGHRPQFGYLEGEAVPGA